MTLASTAGNKKKAAAILDISRRTLYDKLKRHHLLKSRKNFKKFLVAHRVTFSLICAERWLRSV